jgi:hypothetical protein
MGPESWCGSASEVPGDGRRCYGLLEAQCPHLCREGLHAHLLDYGLINLEESS